MLLKNTLQFFKYRPVAALGFLFSSSSLMIAVWASALPFIKTRLGLSDGSLGFLLLLGPAGSMTGVLFSTKVFSKIKVGQWLGVGNIFHALMICVEVLAPNVWVFGMALFCRGMVGFLNGVAINAVAAHLEKTHNRRFLSTCHAMYSVGGALGAAFAAVTFGLNLGSHYQIITMFIIVSIVIILLRHHFVIHDFIIHSGGRFTMPNRSIIGLSFICLVLFMCEGSVVDWSSIYLQRDILAPLYLISFGYGGFSLAMTLGRLNGDVLIPKIGEKRIIIIGTLVASAGILMVSLSSLYVLVLLGFILTGIGCFSIVPVLFSASAKIPEVSPVQGFGMVTSGGLIGFLAGPSAIGFISDQWNLSTGFLFVLFMLLLACFAGWKNKFLN